MTKRTEGRVCCRPVISLGPKPEADGDFCPHLNQQASYPHSLHRVVCACRVSEATRVGIFSGRAEERVWFQLAVDPFMRRSR